MTYEKFEHQVIKMLLESEDSRLGSLFEQYLDAEVISRKETEMGFSVEFLTSERLAVGNMAAHIWGVEAKISETEIVKLELVINNGLVDRLKGVFTSKIPYAELVSRFNDIAFSYENGETSVVDEIQAVDVDTLEAESVAPTAVITEEPIVEPEPSSPVEPAGSPESLVLNSKVSGPGLDFVLDEEEPSEEITEEEKSQIIEPVTVASEEPATPKVEYTTPVEPAGSPGSLVLNSKVSGPGLDFVLDEELKEEESVPLAVAEPTDEVVEQELEGELIGSNSEIAVESNISLEELLADESKVRTPKGAVTIEEIEKRSKKLKNDITIVVLLTIGIILIILAILNLS